MSKWVNTGGAETGSTARRFDVVLPHTHAGESNLQQSTSPQPRAGDHAAKDERRPAIEAAVRPLYAEGYTKELSYCAGDTIEFCVSTSAPTFTLTVARIGAVCEGVPHWNLLTSPNLISAHKPNQIALQTDVFEQREVVGAAYDVPENAASHGCSWPVSFQLLVPLEWKTGYYEATVSVEDDGGADWTHRGRRTAASVMGFVVRAARPGATTRILLQLATNTYAAYNNWGGHCLCAFSVECTCMRHRYRVHTYIHMLHVNCTEQVRCVWAAAAPRDAGVIRAPLCWAVSQVGALLCPLG